MKVIAITGGIATGKSTVSNYLVAKGYPVIDTDKLSRAVVEPGTYGLMTLVDHFGPQILLMDGQLNRQALADLIFNDPQHREYVNQLLHPLVSDLATHRIVNYEKLGEKLVFVDIPLYYEGKATIKVDEVWVVYVPESIQFARLIRRDGRDEPSALRRIKSQLPIEEKIKRADSIIDNTGTLEDTYQQIDAYLTQMNDL